MDIFVANSAAADQLFKNNRDGLFTEINNTPITSTSINSEGSCWADWDNDSDLDLIVGSGGNQSAEEELRLYQNEGAGNSIEMEDGELSSLIERYKGLSSFDYEQDGDLDIFISNYFNNNNLLYNNRNDNRWINIALTGSILILMQ